MGASFAYHSMCKLKTCSTNSFHLAMRSQCRSVEPVTASITAKVCCSWDGWGDRPIGGAALSLFPASSNADDSAGHLYSVLLFSMRSQRHSERGEYAAGWTHENLTHFPEGRTGAQIGQGFPRVTAGVMTRIQHFSSAVQGSVGHTEMVRTAWLG